MDGANPHPQFFRCPITADRSDAELRVRNRRLQVRVIEQSIDGFSLTIQGSDARHLALGEVWRLRFDGAEYQTHPEWVFHPSDGLIQLGLRRLDDPANPRNRSVSRLGPFSAAVDGIRRACAGTSEIYFSAALLLLMIMLILSPVGEVLGVSKLAAEISGALMSLSERLLF